MILSTRESVAGAARGKALGLALLLALGGATVPLSAQARANGGHSEGSAGEASHGKSQPSGDRGSWNSGGGSGGSSDGGATASPGSGSSGSGNDGSSAQPRSGSGGDRGQWNDRSNRGRDRGHRGGGHYGYGYRTPYYGNPWWGWWGWGWGWGEPYGVYGGYGHGYRDGDEQGALDLDIWPGDTQVWLDGQPIGTVDDFDGFPTYLWLEKGTYDLVFYRDGYQTLARQVSIYSGLTIDVGDRLTPGDSIRPEDLPTKTHVRRDARVEEERDRSERIDADRGRYRDRDRGPDADPQGRLVLSIEPGDASVYLDGKFIGTADEISRLHRGLMVEPGQHRISVVRPGRRGSEQTITIGPGDEEEVEIELEKSDE